MRPFYEFFLKDQQKRREAFVHRLELNLVSPTFVRLCGLVVRVRGEFDSPRYQIFREVVGLERGALSLVSAIEELLG
jgi:hypothetical protein